MKALDPRAARWCVDLGLGDPGLDARLLGEFRPENAFASTDIADRVARLLDSAAAQLAAQTPALRAAWSAAEPQAYAWNLTTTGRDAGQALRAISGVVRASLNDIAAAQSTADAAIDQANATWATFLPGAQQTDGPEAPAKNAAGRTLCAALSAARTRAERAVAALQGASWPDVRSWISAVPAATSGIDVSVPSTTSPQHALDAANRSRLAADLAGSDPHRREFAARIQQALFANADGTTITLQIYDPDAFNGQGRAAVTVGDLRSADHVAMLTPGIANSPAAMGPAIGTAKALRAEADRIAPGERTAVVAWFGYDIPASIVDDVPQNRNPWADGPDITVVKDTVAATTMRNAQQGGTLLAQDSAAVLAMAGFGARLTLIGHSMGSVTSSQAALESDQVDELLMLAAPGAGDADKAYKYRSVDSHDVFVLTYPYDPVPKQFTDIAAAAAGLAQLRGPEDLKRLAYLGSGYNGPYGPDPDNIGFQAERIDVESNEFHGLIANTWHVDFADHGMGNYLGGAGLTAAAAVVVGRTARLPRKQR